MGQKVQELFYQKKKNKISKHQQGSLRISPPLQTFFGFLKGGVFLSDFHHRFEGGHSQKIFFKKQIFSNINQSVFFVQYFHKDERILRFEIWDSKTVGSRISGGNAKNTTLVKMQIILYNFLNMCILARSFQPILLFPNVNCIFAHKRSIHGEV